MIKYLDGDLTTRFVVPECLSFVNVEGSASEILQALNYGDNPLFSQLEWNWGFKPDVANCYCIWDEALVLDLSKCLFGATDMLNPVQLKHNKYGRGFEGRRESEDLRITLKALANLSLPDHSFKIRFPHSYVVACLISFIHFLRDRVKPGSRIKSKGVHSFIDEATEFWRSKFRSSSVASLMTEMIDPGL